MLEVHILSLFPESIISYLESSIMKRAQEKGLFRYVIHNLTDWTVRPTRRVDDRPYGGGAGTILSVEPLTHAIREIMEEYGDMSIFLPSPRGSIIDQGYLESKISLHDKKILLICPHYEGVDARIFDLFEIEEFSLGAYVISSGELASLVWIDGIVRLIPGVISEASLAEESYSLGLERMKEYPQYTRPEVFEGKKVPDILLSGDHKKIEQWKKDSRKN